MGLRIGAYGGGDGLVTIVWIVTGGKFRYGITSWCGCSPPSLSKFAKECSVVCRPGAPRVSLKCWCSQTDK